MCLPNVRVPAEFPSPNVQRHSFSFFYRLSIIAKLCGLEGRKETVEELSRFTTESAFHRCCSTALCDLTLVRVQIVDDSQVPHDTQICRFLRPIQMPFSRQPFAQQALRSPMLDARRVPRQTIHFAVRFHFEGALESIMALCGRHRTTVSFGVAIFRAKTLSTAASQGFLAPRAR